MSQVTRLARAVRRLQTVLLLLLVLYYAYAVVGIELFGGIIECELEEYSGSEPEGDPSDWGLLNFNDLFSALVTLFLLTVNGWDDSLKVRGSDLLFTYTAEAVVESGINI